MIGFDKSKKMAKKTLSAIEMHMIDIVILLTFHFQVSTFYFIFINNITKCFAIICCIYLYQMLKKFIFGLKMAVHILILCPYNSGTNYQDSLFIFFNQVENYIYDIMLPYTRSGLGLGLKTCHPPPIRLACCSLRFCISEWPMWHCPKTLMAIPPRAVHMSYNSKMYQH